MTALGEHSAFCVILNYEEGILITKLGENIPDNCFTLQDFNPYSHLTKWRPNYLTSIELKNSIYKEHS